MPDFDRCLLPPLMTKQPASSTTSSVRPRAAPPLRRSPASPRAPAPAPTSRSPAALLPPRCAAAPPPPAPARASLPCAQRRLRRSSGGARRRRSLQGLARTASGAPRARSGVGGASDALLPATFLSDAPYRPASSRLSVLPPRRSERPHHGRTSCRRQRPSPFPRFRPAFSSSSGTTCSPPLGCLSLGANAAPSSPSRCRCPRGGGSSRARRRGARWG